MAVTENKDVIRRLVEEVWNRGDVAVIDELHTPDTIRHPSATGQLGEIEDTRRFVAEVRAATPDGHYQIEDLIAEGDKVALRWEMHGPSTGQSRSGVIVYRIEGGKIAERWSYGGQ